MRPRTRGAGILPDVGLALFVGVAVLAVDQLSKRAATRGNLSARNSGFLLGIGVSPRVALITVSFVVIAVFTAAILRATIQIGGSVVGPTLVVSGMLGNLADRVRFGSVRDFLVVGPLIINVADLAVAFGLALTVGTLLIRLNQLRKNGSVVTFDRQRLRLVVNSRHW